MKSEAAYQQILKDEGEATMSDIDPQWGEVRLKLLL